MRDINKEKICFLSNVTKPRTESNHTEIVRRDISELSYILEPMTILGRCTMNSIHNRLSCHKIILGMQPENIYDKKSSKSGIYISSYPPGPVK